MPLKDCSIQGRSQEETTTEANTRSVMYEISRMKSSNIISLIKKNKNRQYLVKFYRGECLGSPHTGYGGGINIKPSSAVFINP